MVTKQTVPQNAGCFGRKTNWRTQTHTCV